jgi:uncharacterized lipoprotein
MRFAWILVASAGLALSGCVNTVPVSYAPSSTLTASGAVDVGDFKYLPAAEGKVKPNQLKNTAVGGIHLDQDISVFYRNAVFTELRFVGVKVASDNVRLIGEIKEFLVDDLGYSVDWTVDVRYIVTNKTTGAVLYDSEKVTKNKTNKFVNALVALNQQMKANIEALIQDPAFTKSIN